MIVITDCDHPTVDEEAAVFDAAGLPWRSARCTSADDVIREGWDAEALLIQYAPITERVLDALPNCRVIGRYGVGLDTIDQAAAAERGVRLVNVPDYCVEEAANHTIALVLALTRGIVRLDRAVRAGTWDFRSGGELRRASRQRLGVIGIGRIGTAVASRAQALGYEVVAFDPGRSTAPVPSVTLDELLETSDVVTIHASLDDGTTHLIDHHALARMKSQAVLVNTARGRIVDEEALVGALRSGQLGGVGLDVLESEPIGDSNPLLSLPNVVLTPHAAFFSRESLVEMKRRAAEGVVAALRETR